MCERLERPSIAFAGGEEELGRGVHVLMQRRGGSERPMVVDCAQARELLGTADEVSGSDIAVAAARAHVGRCRACRVYVEASDRVHRQVALLRSRSPVAARPVGVPPSRRGSSEWWLRAVLGAAGAAQAARALPLLLDGDYAEPGHVSRHAGAFTVAVAIAFLVPMIEPRRARSLLPMALALLGAVAVTSLLDIAGGRVPATPEAAHLPEVVGVACLWLLVRDQQARARHILES